MQTRAHRILLLLPEWGKPATQPSQTCPHHSHRSSTKTLICYWTVWALFIVATALMIHTANRK